VTERLTGIGMYCGMEMNVKKSQVMKISNQPPHGTDYGRSKTGVIFGIFQLFG
jgi:hypothetical protein